MREYLIIQIILAIFETNALLVMNVDLLGYKTKLYSVLDVKNAIIMCVFALTECLP